MRNDWVDASSIPETDPIGPVIRLVRPADDWRSATPENPVIRAELGRAKSHLCFVHQIDPADVELRISREDARVLAESPEMKNYIKLLKDRNAFLPSKAGCLPCRIYGTKVVCDD